MLKRYGATVSTKSGLESRFGNLDSAALEAENGQIICG